jgi:hypothetical protein
LKERGVEKICDCAVPELIGYDDELLIIEMTVVTTPYVLDFAGAYLDWSPDFSGRSDGGLASGQARTIR